MRVEWAKTRARADRWKEEVKLTVEEMRRIIQYLDWRAQNWRRQADHEVRTNISDALKSGLHGYAHKQANIYERLAMSFACRWHPILIDKGIAIPWLSRYVPAPMEM